MRSVLRSRFLLLLCCASLLSLSFAAVSFGASPASGPLFAASAPDASAPACAATLDEVVQVPTLDAVDDSLLFTLPSAEVLGAEAIDVQILAGDRWVAGETFRSVTVRDDDLVALELFAEASAIRDHVARYSAEAAAEMRVDIRVDGRALSSLSLAELRSRSDDAKQLGLLPSEARRSAVQGGDDALSIFAELPMKRIPVCGDGVCYQSGFINEDCETCPEDCGGQCQICGNGYCGPLENCTSCSADCGACPTCPTNLGTETRTVIVSTSSGGISCLRDIYYYDASSYYQVLTYNYKRYDVQRTRQCDGSITETTVPGTTVYFSQSCYQYLSWPCSFGYLYPSCVF